MPLTSFNNIRKDAQGAINVQVLSRTELLVWLSGYFTEESDVAPFASMVNGWMMQGFSWLIVDMHSVEFISSRLLSTLVSARRRFQTVDGDVLLVDISEGVMDILSLTGMNHYFTVLNSVAAARLRIIETSR